MLVIQGFKLTMQYPFVKCPKDHASCVILSFAAQVTTWGFVKWENLSNAGRKAAGAVKPQVCFLFHCEFVCSEGTLNSNCY